jgi:uncharacterized protein (DUF2147 family)
MSSAERRLGGLGLDWRCDRPELQQASRNIRAARRLLAAVLFGFLSGLIHAQDTPVGLWKTIDDDGKTEKSLIRVTEERGALTGRVERLLDHTEKPDAVCEKCTDERKDQPVLGMTVIRDVRRRGGESNVWDGGEILDPDNGRTYRLRLTLGANGKTLAVRGYIGAPILGRTQTWIRVE